MSYELTGKLLEKFAIAQRTETFKVREFVVEKSEEINGKTITNYIKFQCVQDRTNIVDRVTQFIALYYSWFGRIMASFLERITVNPEQCGGRACIRGMRIRVVDVLDLFVADLSAEQILDEIPDLEKEDLQAVLRYASEKLNHPTLSA